MPRTICIVCSGICFLFTNAAWSQVPLPKYLIPQKDTGYTSQQWAGTRKPLLANTTLYKFPTDHRTHRSYLKRKNLMNAPADETLYGFSIKPGYSLYPDYSAALKEENSRELLDLYMARYKVLYAGYSTRPMGYNAEDNFGSLLLRSFIESRLPAQFDTYKSRRRR